MEKIIEYYGEIVRVNLDTLEIHVENAQRQWAQTLNRRHYIQWKSTKGFLVPRYRLICLAAHPNDDYMNLQVDHIDDDPTNDRPENLRWVTRKENNSKQHARMMKSQHAHHIKHYDDFLVAEKDDEKQVFLNGAKFARFAKCSNPYVYMCMKAGYKVRGWSLRWVNRDDEEVKDFKAAVDAEILEKKQHRLDVIAAIREARKAQTAQKRAQKKAEKKAARDAYRASIAQKKAEKKAARERAKEDAKNAKYAEKLEKKRSRLMRRIELWRQHLADRPHSNHKVVIGNIQILQEQMDALK